MKVLLSGYNIETAPIREEIQQRSLSPEVFSAAYARISRSARSIEELREKARKDIRRARRSNRRIIFQMGHHSVAEHAVFNFDIIGVSRLALEALERFRLVSYTEKSQRYVTLSGDVYIPPAILDSPLEESFRALVGTQNRFYQETLNRLQSHFRQKSKKPGESPGDPEGLAREDARYILSLATRGQVGVTLNGRNLEYLLRQFALSPLEEVRELGRVIYREARKIAPSILLFPEPSLFEKDLYSPPPDNENPMDEAGAAADSFRVVDHTPGGDDKVLAGLIMQMSGLNYLQAREEARHLPPARKESLFRNFFASMAFFDRPPREFELPSISFHAVVSAACFAQLKRHRMATLLTGNYSAVSGNTIPPSIVEAGLEEPFREIIQQTNTLYRKLTPEVGRNADYLLTNSHRRPVLMKMNLRELFHFSRLREDIHAQWDIRHLAYQVSEAARSHFPLSTRLLCGKSDFSERYRREYGHPPVDEIS